MLLLSGAHTWSALDLVRAHCGAAVQRVLILEGSKACYAALMMRKVPGSVMPGVFLQASVQCKTCGSLLQAPLGATEPR